MIRKGRWTKQHKTQDNTISCVYKMTTQDMKSVCRVSGVQRATRCLGTIRCRSQEKDHDGPRTCAKPPCWSQYTSWWWKRKRLRSLDAWLVYVCVCVSTPSPVSKHKTGEFFHQHTDMETQEMTAHCSWGTWSIPAAQWSISQTVKLIYRTKPAVTRHMELLASMFSGMWMWTFEKACF